ncbi:MAG: hypothetical protein ACC628_21040 [Pirellulaceae bacterium]
MILDLVPGWTMELDRGPGWLFVRLRGTAPFDAQGIGVADRVVKLLEQEFGHRVVVELDDVDMLRSELVGELVRLHKRVCSRDGLMRVSGLSDSNYEVLRTNRLHHRFPRFHSRADAVMGTRPCQPR